MKCTQLEHRCFFFKNDRSLKDREAFHSHMLRLIKSQQQDRNAVLAECSGADNVPSIVRSE